MKSSVSTFLLLAVCHGGFALNAEQSRVIVSVLSPMAYGPNCRSNVELQNLGTRDGAVNVEGHKGSGALVAPTVAKPVRAASSSASSAQERSGWQEREQDDGQPAPSVFRPA